MPKYEEIKPEITCMLSGNNDPVNSRDRPPASTGRPMVQSPPDELRAPWGQSWQPVQSILAGRDSASYRAHNPEKSPAALHCSRAASNRTATPLTARGRVEQNEPMHAERWPARTRVASPSSVSSVQCETGDGSRRRGIVHARRSTHRKGAPDRLAERLRRRDP